MKKGDIVSWTQEALNILDNSYKSDRFVVLEPAVPLLKLVTIQRENDKTGFTRRLVNEFNLYVIPNNLGEAMNVSITMNTNTGTMTDFMNGISLAETEEEKKYKIAQEEEKKLPQAIRVTDTDGNDFVFSFKQDTEQGRKYRAIYLAGLVDGVYINE